MRWRESPISVRKSLSNCTGAIVASALDEAFLARAIAFFGFVMLPNLLKRMLDASLWSERIGLMRRFIFRMPIWPTPCPSLLLRCRAFDCGHHVFRCAQLLRALVELRAAAAADVKHLRRSDVVSGAADRILRVIMQVCKGGEFLTSLLVG